MISMVLSIGALPETGSTHENLSASQAEHADALAAGRGPFEMAEAARKMRASMNAALRPGAADTVG